MLAYLLPDGLTRMHRGLQRLANPSTWMEPLLEQGVRIVYEHNRMGLMLGRDIHGRAFAPVKRKHGGPPLLENPARYRAINYALVDAGQLSRDTFEIRLSWPTFKTEAGRDILAMHMKPWRRRPARQAIGIRQTAIDEFRSAGRRYLGREFRELTNAVYIATPGPGGTSSAILRGRR